MNPKPRLNSLALWCVTIISLITSVFTMTYTFLSHKKDIVCVDAIKLISKYKGLEDAKSALQKRNEMWKQKLDTLKNEFEVFSSEYKSKRNSISGNALKVMEQQLNSKQQALFNYEKTYSEQMRKQDEELASKLLVKVNDYLKRYGKKNEYTIILAATQMGNVAYTNESFDITDDVLEGLNAEYLKMKKK